MCFHSCEGPVYRISSCYPSLFSLRETQQQVASLQFPLLLLWVCLPQLSLGLGGDRGLLDARNGRTVCSAEPQRQSGLSSQEDTGTQKLTQVAEGFLKKGHSGEKEKRVLGRAGGSQMCVCAGTWGGHS